MSFMEKVGRRFEEGRHVCVGLDTDPAEFSEEVQGFLREKYHLPPFGATGPLMRSFNQAIIDATKNIAACYKLNRAFYDAQGFQGAYALHATAEYLREAAPDALWILDAKYGDIGNTTRKYAQHAFEFLQADAVTVNPWGGRADGIDAFLEYEDRGVFVWCRGSNEGAREFQDIERQTISTGGMVDEFLYELVAERVSGFNEYTGPTPEDGWNYNRNCGVVVGASNLNAIENVRRLVGDMPILVPGIGAQGGNLEAAARSAGPSTLFNSSRGIIYASRDADFAKAARRKVLGMNRKIRKVFAEVSA